jgi:hypothetical protein
MENEMSNDAINQGIRNENHALIDVRFGRSSARLEVSVTPLGLISVGILVSSILLSVGPIIRAATRQK